LGSGDGGVIDGRRRCESGSNIRTGECISDNVVLTWYVSEISGKFRDVGKLTLLAGRPRRRMAVNGSD
jgi:hypothetical protein